MLTPAEVHAILVAEAGASADDLEQFEHHWPGCVEYRFGGSLGMGGKVWADEPPTVTCYRESETPERVATIERTNAALAEAWSASRA